MVQEWAVEPSLDHAQAPEKSWGSDPGLRFRSGSGPVVVLEQAA